MLIETDRALVKRFVEGTERLCAPSETLDRVAPLLPSIGVTRLADLTRLDRIGLPVVAAFRPPSRGLVVSLGKGLTRAAARASAAMESIEQHSAERIDRPRIVETFAGLGPQAALDPSTLALARGSSYRPDAPIEWIEGTELATGGSTWVPYELVHTDFRIVSPLPAPSFSHSTNGLASGNHLLEAILHGLYEVIERDAATLYDTIGPPAGHPHLDLDSIAVPEVVALREALAEAGVEAVCYEMTSDVGVPAFGCRVRDADVDCGWAVLAPAAGHGCHLSPVVALLRAITEAAQGRLGVIAGARDDLFASQLDRIVSPDNLAALREFEDRAPRTGLLDPASGATDTIDGDLRVVLDRLSARGLDRVVAVDLTRPELEVPVARVVVPGLEGSGHDVEYRPGRRASEAFLRRLLSP